MYHFLTASSRVFPVAPRAGAVYSTILKMVYFSSPLSLALWNPERATIFEDASRLLRARWQKHCDAKIHGDFFFLLLDSWDRARYGAAAALISYTFEENESGWFLFCVRGREDDAWCFVGGNSRQCTVVSERSRYCRIMIFPLLISH